MLLKRLKSKIVNWLLKDVEVQKLIVKSLQVGNKTITIDANKIVFPPLTSDPNLAQGAIWYRSDLNEWRYSPDGSTVESLCSKVMLDNHKNAVPIDHPDRSITRSKLEYPTENVFMMWLVLIEKATFCGRGHFYFLTIDSFTDKNVQALTVWIKGISTGFALNLARADLSASSWYFTNNQPAASTADFGLWKRVEGLNANLGTEAVDIPDWQRGITGLSCSGSSIKALRSNDEGVDVMANIPIRISVTDTDISSGRFGISDTIRSWQETTPDHSITSGEALSAYLKPPASISPKALAIVECEVTGKGTEEDPYRPLLAKEISMHSEYGNIDKLAVTWGAFDYKLKDSTMIIVITNDNPYQNGAYLKQVEYAKSKNLKALIAPKDYREAIEQYKMLKNKHPYWLAGKDNYAYQTLGLIEFELFQLADFYYGELIEHRIHYKQLKQVPDWELERIIKLRLEQMKRINILHEERNKHIKKLEEVLKKGW